MRRSALTRGRSPGSGDEESALPWKPFKNSQLGRPVRQSQAQPLRSGWPFRISRFDGRELPAAAVDSRGDVEPLGRQFLEWPASPSSTARLPLNSCQRRTITSQYFGSNSISRAWRPAFSHAISVVPEPPNGSSTVSRPLLLLRMARSTNSTGFIVGCRSFTTGFFTNQTSPWSRAPHQKWSVPSFQP